MDFTEAKKKAAAKKAGKKCPECGKALKMMYPGGDPESGPAAMRCPSGCQGAETCDICGKPWHDDPKPTPKRPGIKHDSFGNGLPEVDAENDKWEKAHPMPENESRRTTVNYKQVNEKIAPITEEMLLEARVSTGLDALSEALSEANIKMDAPDFDSLVESVHGLLMDNKVPAETRRKVFAAWQSINAS